MSAERDIVNKLASPDYWADPHELPDTKYTLPDYDFISGLEIGLPERIEKLKSRSHLIVDAVPAGATVPRIHHEEGLVRLTFDGFRYARMNRLPRAYHRARAVYRPSAEDYVDERSLTREPLPWRKNCSTGGFRLVMKHRTPVVEDS